MMAGPHTACLIVWSFLHRFVHLKKVVILTYILES